MSERHDQMPVLPGEAKSLPTHVERCAERYTALLRFHYELSARLRRMQLEGWIFRGVGVVLLGSIGWLLQKLLDKLP